jgi:hypothetical protein
LPGIGVDRQEAREHLPVSPVGMNVVVSEKLGASCPGIAIVR